MDNDRGPDELHQLMMAIHSFNKSTSNLADSYRKLEERVKRLDLELEEKNAELQRNLGENERVKSYLRNVLESLWTGVLVLDTEGRITTLNRAVQSLLNPVQSEEVIGREIEDLLSFHLIDREPIEWIRSMEAIEGREMEVRWRDKGGRRLRMKMMISRMTDSSDKPIGWILLLQDVTTLRRFEDQVNRNRKLTAMGEMAVDIAHKVRNPLGSIELFASLLRKELEEDEDKASLADNMLVSVKNLDHIISNLLTFTKAQRPFLKELDLHPLLEEVLRFVQIPLKYSNVTIKKVFGGKEPKILGDKELLKQAFFNIILNAMQAMEGGGCLLLQTRIVERDPVTMGKSGKGIRAERDPNGLVEIEFRDNGQGIPEEELQKIFNPFYTRGGKKSKDGRAGLGLAIVHNIVESHRGTTNVDSVLHQGTVVTVTLPLL